MSKNKGKNSIARLFFIMLRIGSIGFGGGNALIPVIREQVIEKNALLSEEEYEEDVLIASITPGALPVEIAGGIGHRVKGWIGTLACSYGMALPGVILSLLLLSTFRLFNSTVTLQIRYITVGIAAFITVLLIDYIIGTLKEKRVVDGNVCDDSKKTALNLIIILIVAALTGTKNVCKIVGLSDVPFISISTIDVFIIALFIIFCCATGFRIWKLVVSVSGGILYIIAKSCILPIDNVLAIAVIRSLMGLLSLAAIIYTIIREHGKFVVRDKSRFTDLFILLATVFVFLVIACFFSLSAVGFVGKGALSSVISFGGGDAYLTVADGIFVTSGDITENDFYGSIVPIVNVLPGSILCKTLSCVGYVWGSNVTGSVVGGIVFALAGFSVSIFASCGIFSLVHACYSAVSDLVFFKAIKRWIRPIVSGLMISVILSLIYQVRSIDAGNIGWLYVVIMIVLFAVGMILRAKKVNNIVGILICVAIASISCNIIGRII